MKNLEGVKVVVTGGSRGLGLGIVEALSARKAQITVVARDAARLDDVAKRLGVSVVSGDVADEALARSVLGDVRPSVLVLNAGAKPGLGLIHEQSWEGFSRTWGWRREGGLSLGSSRPSASAAARASDVFGLDPCGAAVSGSPLSGGYAGRQAHALVDGAIRERFRQGARAGSLFRRSFHSR